MSKPRKLSASEISERLGSLEGWHEDNGKLCKDFRFADFVGAFGFMTAAALHAERLNHHPEWHNVYSQVSVALSTHDCDGISELDFELASCMNQIAG